MTYTPFGGHIENPDDWQQIDVGRYRDTFGPDGTATLLHLQLGVLPELRRQCPDALLLVRCYLSNWYTTDPREWARECADIYQRARPYTRHCTFANEQDLAAESGGLVGATASRPISVEDYRKIARWNDVWLDEFRAQPDTGDCLLHYPALAGGHQDVDGLVGYEYLRRGIARVPVLDCHLYPSIDVPVDDEWRGAARIDKVLALFPGKPIFLSEVGDFAVTDPRAPDHLVACGYYWQSKPAIIGFTYFLMANPTGAEGNQPNDLSRNPAVFEALKRATKVQRSDNLTQPSGTGAIMPSIDVGPGLARVEPLIGPFDASEDWKWPGSQRETSIIATARGYACWRRSTNQVTVICDDGSMWSDMGNRGNGVLQRIRFPYDWPPR